MKKTGKYSFILPLFFLALWTNAASAQEENNCIASTDKIEGMGVAIPSLSFFTPQDKDLSAFVLQQVNPKIKLLLIGEQHWMDSINGLVTSLVTELSEKRDFKNLVIEYAYSYTGFLNAFVNLPPGEGNELLKRIQGAFDMAEEINFLKAIQAWNYRHPAHKIRLLCADFEQDYSFPVINILLPYFKAFGDSTILNHIKKVQDVDDKLLFMMDSILSIIPSDFKSQEFAFLDKPYIENTLLNLKSAFNGQQQLAEKGEDGFNAFMRIRTKQIIQNLSAKDIFGKHLNHEKTIFWAGANHIKKEIKKESQGFINEGTYFKKKFKRKALSFNISTLCYKSPDLYYEKEVNTNLSSYNMLVSAYLDCYPKPAQKYLLLEPFDPATQWILSNMQLSGRSCTVLSTHNNAILKGLWKDNSITEDYLQFDYHIFLKESTLFSPPLE